MVNNRKAPLIVLLVAAFLTLSLVPAKASDLPASSRSSYTSLNQNVTYPSQPLVIEIGREQCIAYHWRAGQVITIQAYVEGRGGRKHFLRDHQGQRSWKLFIGKELEGSVSIAPALNNYTGRLTVTGDGNILSAPTPYLSETLGRTLEKVHENRFRDGASVKVHFTDQILDENNVAAVFPKQVLDAAVIAYQTITQIEGFNTPGFSFVEPDRSYAYDPDKTIDIYLGNSNTDNLFKFHGFLSQSFRDAPCFDTVRTGEKAYNAVILLPADYREFIKNWERLNPSPMGARNINVDLRGTLIHEMLHAILFYYNRNLNHESAEEAVVSTDPTSVKKKLDWYVEGLARYFETFAGAKHDFYSQGFRETLPTKIRFSRGGSNYFMRYPDQPFTQLRYENALFWRFIDHQYGMKTIESLSRSFRGVDPSAFYAALESVTQTSFRDLLKKFARASLLNDFGLKEDAVYLKEVARTRLLFKGGVFYLLDGHGGRKELGAVCRTDWIGAWGEFKAHFGELPVGGDNTNISDISVHATDFYEIGLDRGKPELPTLLIQGDGAGEGLAIQLILQTHGGSVIASDWEVPGGGAMRPVDVGRLAAKESLQAGDIAKIYLLITNLDPQKSVNYQISSSI